MIVDTLVYDRAIRFAGYAALFDVRDAANDTIRRGAFQATLSSQDQPLPLLWQHNPDRPIGKIESIFEDERGLRVVGAITAVSSRAAQMLRLKQVDGLSFGYRAQMTRQVPSGRELLAVDLFEVSLVTHPLQHAARIHYAE